MIRVSGDVQLMLQTADSQPFAVMLFNGRAVRLHTINGGDDHEVVGRIHRLCDVDDEKGVYRFQFVPRKSWNSIFFIFQSDGMTSNIRWITIFTMPELCSAENSTFTERASYGM